MENAGEDFSPAEDETLRHRRVDLTGIDDMIELTGR